MSRISASFHGSWVERLKSDPALAIEYLKAEMEENSDMPDALIVALRTIAEAKGFADLAKAAHLSPKSLYKILSDEKDPHPRFETIHKIVEALGMRLTVAPKPPRRKAV